MRVLTTRLALGALVVGTLCLIAEPAEGGPFRRRAARNNTACCPTTSYAAATPCCGNSMPMPMPSGYGYAPVPSPCCPGAAVAYGTSYYGGQITGAGGYIQPGNIIPAGGFPAPMPGAGDTIPANAEKIRMTDGTFSPATLTINVGTTVRWTNEGQHAHTVTSDKGTWGSNEIPVGGDFVATFTKPGTFDYHCKLHNGMKGTIIVK